MLRFLDRSSRRSSRRWRAAFASNLAVAIVASAVGCSIYSSPDGPEDLETGGSSGSKATAGGTGSEGGDGSGGSDAGGDGGSAGSDVGSGGEAGSGGAGGGASGSGGSDGGSAGSGGSTAGSGGSNAGNGGAGGSAGGFAGTGGSGFAGSGGGITELAHNKPATGSSDQAIHTYVHGNDGDNQTRWCAVVGTFPEHWRTDLGALYELTTFEVRWEKGNSDYTYEVATSPDDINYTPQIARTASGQLQTGSMMPGTVGRFVRVTVTNATGNTWASFYEFKVFGRPASGS
jgi:hypothetical protein